MSDLDRYRAPITVLDEQLDLLGWWDSAQGDRWRRVVRGKMVDAIGWEMPVDSMMATIPAALGGWTCWIGADAVQLIEEAARSVPAPDGAIGAGMIPQPAGMMWLAGDPIDLGIVADGDDVFVRALSWAPAMTPTREGSAPGVVVAAWLEGDRQVRPAMIGSLPLSEDAAAMLDDPGDVWATVDLDDVWREDSAEAAAYRWICAAWVMCGQVLPQRIESAPRALRRRANRILTDPMPEWGEVHVTTLRVIPRGGGGEAGDPSYHHRWVVRGHWRWQACGKGLKDRRLKWIAPHIKGPEDAPLVEVEQVAKLVR